MTGRRLTGPQRKRNVSLDPDVYEEIRELARRLRVQPSELVVRAVRLALPALRRLRVKP